METTEQIKPLVDTVVDKPTIEKLPEPSAGAKIWDEIHVNASGLVLFACIAVGILWPEMKPKTDQLAAAAATYLFASAKQQK